MSGEAGSGGRYYHKTRAFTKHVTQPKESVDPISAKLGAVTEASGAQRRVMEFYDFANAINFKLLSIKHYQNNLKAFKHHSKASPAGVSVLSTLRKWWKEF